MLARAAAAPRRWIRRPRQREASPSLPPAVRGSGSVNAMTTRAIPAWGTKAAQVGPRLLSCAQGSSVVNRVAPRAAAPASAIATASAWGRPPGWVAPLPTITPSAATTQPTLGFGAVVPRTARPSAIASASSRDHSMPS